MLSYGATVRLAGRLVCPVPCLGSNWLPRGAGGLGVPRSLTGPGWRGLDCPELTLKFYVNRHSTHRATPLCPGNRETLLPSTLTVISLVLASDAGLEGVMHVPCIKSLQSSAGLPALLLIFSENEIMRHCGALLQQYQCSNISSVLITGRKFEQIFSKRVKHTV